MRGPRRRHPFARQPYHATTPSATATPALLQRRRRTSGPLLGMVPCRPCCGSGDPPRQDLAWLPSSAVNDPCLSA
uniref:Uncharacterized protein n=1 Tax=Setaria viridis TaxID=4556 RepID=A0A4U6VIB1_SETVI|nr:hypothetical protein SEVIR_3G282650v2 [Setaria viridis]